jgi:hypothetical protein
MTPTIIEKLRRHLSKPISREPDVVYLLAEVRKVLERDDPGRSSAALWMYCHWALHVNLTSPRTTMDFLRRVDRWITNTVAYLTPSGPWEFIEEHYLFRDFIFLSTLRQQLHFFLAGYGLPLSVCDSDQEWYTFLEAYATVIEDGSLSTISDRNGELGAVKRVTFNKGKALTAKHHVPFVIEWSIELKDGRILRTEAETLPTDSGNMTAHHLEIVNGSFVPPH